MAMSGTIPSQFARTACLSCRQGKRRCDRALPSCQLCTKKDIECSYPARRTARQKKQGPEPPSNQTNAISTSPASSQSSWNYAAISFIAPHLCPEARVSIPRPEVPIPPGMLYTDDHIRRTAAAYFGSAHLWMPIVSRRRFFAHLVNPLSQRRMELHLLVSCMNLYCTAPPPFSGNGDGGGGGDGGDGLDKYTTVKQFHFDIENSGLMSIHVLQAGVLIALYEISQAVYPAAYLSVGACARYAVALGIDRLGLELTRAEDQMRSWVEVEEMRRVWWAILILDRLAQSTHLLSKALKSISSSSPEDIEETTQLRRTLNALVTVVGREAEVRQLEFCPQAAICYITILLLERNITSGPVPRGSDRETRLLSPEASSALESIPHITESLYSKCIKDVHFLELISPFMMEVAYQTASILLHIGQENPDTVTKKRIGTIKRILRFGMARWRLAGVYLSILESQEVTSKFS